MTSSWRLSLLVCGLVVSAAAEPAWQTGVLRDVQLRTGDTSTVNIPVGGTPPTTVAGVTIPGTAPIYIGAASTNEWQVLTIDVAADHMRYVARTLVHLTHIIINDPIEFALDGKYLVVRETTPKKKTYKLTVVSRERLP